MQEVGLKTINELLGRAFAVPQYQRGYRWTRREVTDLLDDIWDFAHSKKLIDNYYCLQPIVVSQRPDGKWELIDGQQRLTTIYILLHYLREQYIPKASQPFQLEFDSRPDSQTFLQTIDPARRQDNVDFYHICEARACIEDWINDQDPSDPFSVAYDLYKAILQRTQVIWYPISTTSTHSTFIRINSGKIPLTNAELIKALFLRRGAGDLQLGDEAFRIRQLEIAGDWDRIEAELQRDALWYFLAGDATPRATRIEFIFESLARVRATAADEFATFRYFNAPERLGSDSSRRVLDVWDEVKNQFMLFGEWFDNREFYHLIGYLVAVGDPLDALVDHARALPKHEFRHYLRGRIQAQLASPKRLQDMSYNKDRRHLRKVLLLFNVATLLQNPQSGYRFPFDQLHAGGSEGHWTLEHIHARRDRGLNGSDKYRQWLLDVRPFVEAAHVDDDRPAGLPGTEGPGALLIKIDTLVRQAEIDKAAFMALQEQLVDLFGEADLDTLDNLALLRRDDNSRLSNGPFPQKRARVMELEKQGSFIPIATRNVFLKYYTANPSHLIYWSEKDRDQYLQAIETTLTDYLPIFPPYLPD